MKGGLVFGLGLKGGNGGFNVWRTRGFELRVGWWSELSYRFLAVASLKLQILGVLSIIRTGDWLFVYWGGFLGKDRELNG